MAPIRYSLHYEDYSEHIMCRFGKLLQMQSLVDMTLMCSSHTLRVHKAVLAASSAYFQEVLQKQTGEPLIILKMRFSVLKCLVEFMYCGKTQCLEENLDELVSAAQFLKIKGLSKVTKEGLGITNNNDLPVFAPPVVINRPPQSLLDLSQENEAHVTPPPQLPPTNRNNPAPENNRPNKDMLVRIPFDIENGGATSSGDYPEGLRTVRPRRGRPSRSGGWEGSGPGNLGRAAERALLRREQDSRKAIHHLKHLQSRHMQDYMDRVTLSQAVNSICGPQSSPNYINMDNELLYMGQTVSSNVLNTNMPYSNEHGLGSETITSSYSTNNTDSSNNVNSGIGSAMAQYVNALKSAGLPTDLPILFESGDGSYINVNEQVLLDMVQSNEIQYEVVEQPNIIEKVADPSEIKSIDDLSKSIERGELLLNKSYTSASDYKETTHYSRQDAINSLNAMLPASLESFTEQQNFVVLDPGLPENTNAMDQVNADFSCIDGDMQFFTKSISDDVKQYYNDQQLNDAKVMEQLCPASTTLDTNFNMSLLDSKIAHIGSNLNQHYNLNPEELRRNEDCYDFTSNDFKDPLDCLMATPKRTDDVQNSFDVQLDDKANKERDEIISDLINIETKINMNKANSTIMVENKSNLSVDNSVDIENPMNEDPVILNEPNSNVVQTEQHTDMTAEITSSGLQWDGLDICKESKEPDDTIEVNQQDHECSDSQYNNSVPDLIYTKSEKTDQGNDTMRYNDENNKNDQPSSNDIIKNSTLEEDIPYAVGLLPLKQQIQATQESSLLKRNYIDADLLDDVDAKCLKRKVKCKKFE